MSKFARRCAALMLAVVLLCMAVPAAFAAEGDALPAGATTMGGANTTLIPDEEENCLSWLFGLSLIHISEPTRLGMIS